jgi:hypothetical protein
MPGSLPRDLESGPFSVAEALRRGVTPARLRRVDLRADFHGVRTSVFDVDDVETRCRAYATRLGRHRYFSHTTAAVLWGFRLPPAVERSSVLHVTTVRPARTPRTRGVIGHHVERPEHELVEYRGFLLPTPPETWRMLAGPLDVTALVVAGDGLLCRQHPPATEAQLRRAVARNAGRRGNAKLRAAFDQLRAGTDSARETWLRLVLLAAGLPEPRVNGVVSLPGEPVRYGDLLYTEWKVIVEYEGIHHQTSREVYLADIDRFEQVVPNGWRVVRIAKEHSASDAVRRVQTALVAAGWRP